MSGAPDIGFQDGLERVGNLLFGGALHFYARPDADERENQRRDQRPDPNWVRRKPCVRVRTLATLDDREWDGLDEPMFVAGWLRQCQPNHRRKSSLKS